MDEEQTIAEQEHRDFLREVANDVYGLVRNSANMARFWNRVRLFCEKNEEHEVELRQLAEAYKADAALQAAAEELEREELTEDKRATMMPHELPKGPPKGYKGFVRHFCDFSFWGPPTKTTDLWLYLSTPVEREERSFFLEDQDTWRLEALKSSDDEKIISCYALLAAVHDLEIPEKPIYIEEVYDGRWSLRDTWIQQLSQKCLCLSYAWEPDTFQGAKDIRAWIARALDDVKADLAKAKETEKTSSQPELRDFFPDISDDDRRLFLAIGVDLRNRPAEYRDAGKWLDDYYDETCYWERRHSELERLRRMEASGNALTPSQKEDREKLEHEIKERRPPTLDHRLQEAWGKLYSRYRNFISQEDAKAVLLIAWLATDVDADNADLNFTEFEKWSWDSLKGLVRDDGFIQVGRTCLIELLWSGQEEGYEPTGKYEVECLKLVRAAWARREAEKYLMNRPTEEERHNKPMEQPAKESIQKETPQNDDGLSRAERLAYQSYEYAISQRSALAEAKDDDVYDWLREHRNTDYGLPSRETWKRYVRQGRWAYGTRKNNPRKGRTGRSIVRADQIEYTLNQEEPE